MSKKLTHADEAEQRITRLKAVVGIFRAKNKELRAEVEKWKYLHDKSYVRLTFEIAEDNTLCFWGEISDAVVIFAENMSVFQGSVEQYEQSKKENSKKALDILNNARVYQ